jgi:sugar lactone lactonase YvrE
MRMETKMRYGAMASGLAALSLALAGCGVNLSTPSTNYTNAVTLQGQVLAGRNYMSGARVKVYATQPNGVAGSGSYTGSAKLLASVTANTTGGWSLQGVSCTSPDQIYVTAEGGTPYPSGQTTTSLSDNANSLMMTAIGDCATLTSASSTNNNTPIVTNEASTVAAVWALKNFISLSGTTVNVTSSATNYAGVSGVGTKTSFAGLAHAFANANNLAPYKLGAFPQYTQGATSGTGGGLLPVQELNSLAYAQYLCTIGGTNGSGDYSYCTQLYQLATPPSGTAPTNSLQAMLNIARYPVNNAAAILNFTLTSIPYTTQTGSQQINAGVYVPALTSLGSLTNDWSVAISYGYGYAATSTGQGISYPTYVAVDANDNVYTANPSASTSTGGNVVALTSSGASLWTSATDSTYLLKPNGIAADGAGHLWVVNNGTTAAQSFVEEFDAASGSVVQRYPSTSLSLVGMAVDSLGNVWYGSGTTTGQNLHELLASTSYSEASFPVVPSSTITSPMQIRADGNGNIWAAGYSAATAQALYLPNTGTAASPTYTAGLKTLLLSGNSAYGVTVDASGNAYVPTGGSSGTINLVSVTGSGTSVALSAAGTASNPATASVNADTDGAGTVWYMDHTTGTYIYNYIPSNGALYAYYPCYNTGTMTGTGTATSTVQTCSTGISTRWDMAIDSTGSIWVGSYGNSSSSNYPRLAQIIGLAAPTVPLRALGKAGVMP